MQAQSPAEKAREEKGPSATLDPADFIKKRELEITLLASSVVAIGFESRVDRKKDGGAFDALVLNNVKTAANAIAPNKLISGLSDQEKMAITTVAIQASTPGFLDQMKRQDPKMFSPEASRFGPKIVEASKKIVAS